MQAEFEAKLAALGKEACELGRRVADLRTVEPHADKAGVIRLGLFEQGKAILFAEMAQEAHDDMRRDAQLCLAIFQGLKNAVGDRCERDATLGMGLGIEEDFDMANIVSGGPLQVGPCQVVKVLLVQQHRHALIIDVQEFLQVREGICCLGVIERFEGRLYSVALSNLHHQFRLEAALDVQVQFGFWQFGDECGAVSHSGPQRAV